MTKKSEQKTKKSFLTTSPDKFQQEHGNGSFNTECQSVTGKSIAAILKPTPASLFELESLSILASAATWPFPKKEKSLDESGMPMETAMNEATSSENHEPIPDELRLWRMLYLPTK